MSHATSANERVLDVSLLFRQLDPALVGSFARTSVRVRYARGEYLWRARTPATSFTEIASGLVKVVRTGADGHETILAILGPRESVGDAAVIASKPYPADAVAVSDSVEVVRIDSAIVRAAMESHPSMMAAINASLIEHIHALQEKIRIMSAGTVPKRLATLLLHLATRFGDHDVDGHTFIPLALSRAECACLVGATVETTIRTFSQWQKEGLVATTPDGFALRDVSRLERLTAA